MTDLSRAAGLLTREWLTRWSVPIACAVAVLVIGVLLIALFNAEPKPGPADIVERQAPPASTPAATLTRAHQARWAAPAVRVGDELRPGTSLTLDHGLAELTTARGARVVIEGPATLTLGESGDGLSLMRGRVVAYVPPSASGFTIQTPAGRVTDLGTEFGVEVGPTGETRALTFVGVIELRGKAGTTPSQEALRVTAGWVGRIDAGGLIADPPAPASAAFRARFVRSVEPIDPADAYRRSVLASRPSVYWRFDQGPAKVRNETGRTEWDGRSIGKVSRADGLFGSAARFTGDLQAMGGIASDHAVPIHGSRGYTLEAWCYSESAHFGRLIGLAEMDPAGARVPSHFAALEVVGGDDLPSSFLGRKGQVRFLHRSPPAAGIDIGASLFAPGLPRAGQWVHVVAVHDQGEMRLYLNGELAGRQRDEQPASSDPPLSLYVGVSPIVMTPERSTNPLDFRVFHGLIDEVAVYERVLPDRVIREHYDLGRATLSD